MRRTLALLFLAVLPAPRAALSQGAPVGPEFIVNSHTTGAQEGASVASDALGNFVVVWLGLGQDGSGSGVFGQRYASGGTPLGPEFRVNSYTTNDQFVPAVASGAAGNFVVVWTSEGQDASDWGVFGQRYDSAGAPLGPEFRVNTHTTNGQSYPSVAADSSGNFVVVWSSFGQDNSGWGVFGQRYSGAGAPLGAEFRVNTYTTSAQWMPSVASDAAGNFVVAWDSYHDGSYWGVFGQRYSGAGAPLGAEFRVNTYTTARQRSASLAADGSGNFVIVWDSFQDGSLYAAVGQRYSGAGAPLGPEFRVNTFTTGYQGAPSVAADDAGNFVVVWQSLLQDGSSWGVFGQRYASSGVPLGSEFRVNTYTSDGQSSASVAADSSGDFVVVWKGYGQDGSAYSIVGQRYSAIVPVSLTGFGVE